MSPVCCVVCVSCRSVERTEGVPFYEGQTDVFFDESCPPKRCVSCLVPHLGWKVLSPGPLKSYVGEDPPLPSLLSPVVTFFTVDCIWGTVKGLLGLHNCEWPRRGT